MTIHSVTIAHCEQLDVEGELGLDDGGVLVDLLLFASGSCLGFGHKMYFVGFAQVQRF